MPISLSYHASGLKVQEMASWVGAGWSLNAGGAITRSVVGLPDDRGIGNTTFVNGHYSDTGFNNYLFIPGSGYGTTSDGKKADDINFLRGYKDGEPDLFTFNFNGYSGKFYFNDDRTPILVPEQDIKIETDFALGSGFTGFTITTPDGSKYSFGNTNNSGSVNPTETIIPMTFEDGPLFQQKAASSWFLNKIVSADATDSIVLKYQSESYSYYTLSMFPVTFYKNAYTGPSASEGYNLVQNLVQGARLSEITFPNGTILFNPSATPRTDLLASWPSNGTVAGTQPNTNSFSLESIEISTTNSFCKKFNFKYGYFYDNGNNLSGPVLGNSSFNNINVDRYKLRLDTLQEVSCDGSIQIPPHLFTYFSEKVPRILSLGIDHWGYYNGVTNNSGLIPAHVVKYQSLITEKAGANRDAAFPAMRGGTLQKITYPTGGYSLFDYEANTTYVSYTTYAVIPAYSASGGYDGHNGYLGDGGSNPLRTNFTLSGNPYTLTVTNSANGGTATVELYNSSNNVVFASGGVNLGETKTFTLSPPAGSYYIILQKNSASTGNGAGWQLIQHSPITQSGNTIVGGLRIKTVTTNDGITSNNILTSYNYNVGGGTGSSSGILYSRPVYVKLVKNSTYDLVYPVPAPGCQALVAAGNPGLRANVADQYYLSPTSVKPMQTVQGHHIGYNEVKVSQTGNGYSIYRYYGSDFWDTKLSDVCTRLVNWDNLCDPEIPQTPAAPEEFEFKRGELKFEGYYNETGNVVRSVWRYPQFEDSRITTPGMIIGLANDNLLGTYYWLRSARKIADSTEESVFSSSGYITKTNVTYYSSAYHRQPTQKVLYASDGDRLATNYTYALDFLPSTCTSINDGLSVYETGIANDTAALYTTLSSCTPQTGITSCRFPTFQQFRRNINLHRISYFNTRRANFSRPVNTYTTAHNNAKAAALSDYKPILELHDQFINPVIETSSWQNNQLLKSNITFYAYNANPSGEVYPSLSQQLDLLVPSATFTKAAVNGSNTALVKDSRYEDLSNYKFDGGNLTEITGRDGVTTSYIWGNNNMLPIIKAVGVAYSTLKAAFVAAGSDPEATRNQASLSSALLSTYTHQPLVGVTSETDPSLKKISYEYDKLFRLLRVRDGNNNILKQYDYKYQINGAN
ncbi:MAG: hypothetical protein J7497_02205 [Chitinophagaceae bacterium]|nr:hypothetical protein [Chitinophagaceae bacterium]